MASSKSRRPSSSKSSRRKPAAAAKPSTKGKAKPKPTPAPSPPPPTRHELRINEVYEPMFRWNTPARYAIMTGGRGSGKSFGVAAALVAWMDMEPGRKILYTRYTMVSAKDSIIPEFTDKIDRLGLGARFQVAATEITHVNGSKIMFRGIKTSEGIQTAKLKSIQGVNCWVLDEAEELPDEDLFDKIDLSIRDGHWRNRIILVLNPAHKSHWIYRRWFSQGKRGDTLYIHTDYTHNARNLPPDYIAKAEECKLANPQKFARVWLGEWFEEIEGAICTFEMVQFAREAMDFPAFRRIVVAIDPQAKAGENSDDTGIVCVALGIDNRYYVLEDGTLNGSPAQWAAAAVAMYHRWKADRIVAEVNNGGDMVEFALRSIDADLPYSAVHASRGKLIRAEPISALYENGKVSHAAGLAKLEAELMTYSGKTTDDSPNRLDAMVWAFWELMRTPGVVDVDLERALL